MAFIIPILPLNTSRIQPLLPMTLPPPCGKLDPIPAFPPWPPTCSCPFLESTSTQPPVDAFKKAIRPLPNTLQWLSMLLRIKLSPYNGLCGWTQSVPPVCTTLHPINFAHLHSCRFLLLCTHFDPARLTSWLFPEYLSMLLAWCL